MTTTDDLLARYEAALLGVFGAPALVIEHGQGCWIWDSDGRKYLDLLSGIAVNALGHNHPEVVAAVSKTAAQALHVSNFFTTRAQIELGERLLEISGAPEGSRVFLANSGTEAIEAAIKLARRSGRTGILAAEGAFHGRTTGALALTHKAAYRDPFAPLIPGVEHVPYDDLDALAAALGPHVGAVVLEPVQGEAGVRVPAADYLRGVRELTRQAGALLILDEVQTGIARTGPWFAFQEAGVLPDAVAMAKGLGGGVPIGALLTIGPEVSGLLTQGMHGSTFGGNPLAAATALAVLETIERDGLRENAITVGERLRTRIAGTGHPMIASVRGRGLLIAFDLAQPVAAELAALAREAGFIINPVGPATIRLAPPLILTLDEADHFVNALPAILDAVGREEK